MSAPVKGRPYWKAANDVAQFVGVEIHVEDDGSIHVEGDEGFDTDCGPAKDSAVWDRRIADAVATLAAVAVKCGDHYCPLHDDGGFGPTLKPCTCEDDEPMTPVPVPVGNEVVEKVARLAWIEAARLAWIEACEGSYEPWDELPRVRRDSWKGVARAMLDVPEVAAAFEAQAKLEALLAGDGDLPEGWTRQYRVVWTDRITPSAAIESAWSDNPDFVEVVREKFKPERIERFEQSIRSTAVRVEEGGES